MSKITLYTINHLLIGFLLSFLLYTFNEYIWFFIGLEIVFLFIIKDQLFKLFKILFVTSFFALFVIHNIGDGFTVLQWDFVKIYWIRILYLFLFISWVVINLRITHIISLLKQIGFTSDFNFLVINTFIMLKRIPIKLNQIFEVQWARRVISKNPLKRVMDYPKIVVPLIISLFRDLDYFVVNYYVLNNYNLQTIPTTNKLFSNGLLTVLIIFLFLILFTFNIWLK